MAKSSYTTSELAGLVLVTCRRYYQTQNFDNLDLIAHLKLCTFNLSKYATEESSSGFFIEEKTLVEESNSSGTYVYSISSFQNSISKILSGYSTGSGGFPVCDYQKVQSAHLSTEMDKQPVGGIVDSKLKVYFGTVTPGTVTLLILKQPSIVGEVIEIPDSFAHLLVLLTAESILVVDGKKVPEGLLNQIKERVELLK